MKEDNLVVLAEYSTVIEAEMAKSLLESEDVAAEIDNDIMSGLYPTGAIPCRLLVAERDVQRAGLILKR